MIAVLVVPLSKDAARRARKKAEARTRAQLALNQVALNHLAPQGFRSTSSLSLDRTHESIAVDLVDQGRTEGSPSLSSLAIETIDHPTSISLELIPSSSSDFARSLENDSLISETILRGT